MWRARRELNPGPPGFFRPGKSLTDEFCISGALPVQDSDRWSQTELRARGARRLCLAFENSN